MDRTVPVTSSFNDLVDRAAQLLAAERRTILGIAGPPAAGKSTVAQAVVDAVRSTAGDDAVALLPMDGYHLPNAVLDARGLRHVKGAPETFDVDAYVALLEGVRAQPDAMWSAPGFRRDTDEPFPGGHRIAPSVRLVVTEGNYLLLPGPWARVRPLCDEIWFLEVDTAVERERLIRRQHEEIGRSLDDAIEFVERSDLGNARTIVEQSGPADLVVRLAEGTVPG